MIVQGVVGHMTPEMTKHYQAHANRETTRLKLLQMPDFMGSPGNSTKLLSEPETELELAKRRLLNQIGDSTDLNKIKRATAIFDK